MSKSVDSARLQRAWEEADRWVRKAKDRVQLRRLARELWLQIRRTRS